MGSRWPNDFTLTEEDDGADAKHECSLPMAAGYAVPGGFRFDESGLDRCFSFSCELARREETNP